MNRHHHSCLGCALYVLSCIIVLHLAVAPVHAQGTSGSLPAPIASDELDLYARMLNLSGAQRLAIEGAHDEYRDLFRTLRDGDIASFLKTQQGVQGGVPQRDQVEAILDDLERIHRQIESLDNRLIDQFLPLLSEQQQAILPRVRLARERRRCAPLLTASAFGRQTVDLGSLFYDLELPADELAQAEVIISSYELRMTSLMRQQHEAQIRTTLDLVNGLAERGYENITEQELLQDPDRLQRLLAAINEIYMEIRGRTAELARDTRTLNVKTYRQLDQVISGDPALQLKVAFHSGAYPEVAGIITMLENEWLTSATRVRSLTDDERAVIEPVASEYIRQLDQLLASAIELADDFWGSISPYELNQQLVEDFQQGLTELLQQATEVQEQADAVLARSFSEEQLAKIRSTAMDLRAEARRDRRKKSGSTVNPFLANTTPNERGLAEDQFLPRAISSRDLSHYQHQLQVEGDLAEIASAIHGDYLARIEALTVLSELRAARLQASTSNDDSADTLQHLDRVAALRRSAVEQIIAEEAQLFDEMAIVLSADHHGLLEHVRNIRLRAAHQGSANRQTLLGSDVSLEATVDVIALLLEQQPAPTLLERVQEILSEYDVSATPAFKARFEVQLDQQRMIDEWSAAIAAAQQESIAAMVEVQNRFRAQNASVAERIRAADGAIIARNRETLQAILAEIPEELAVNLERAYHFAAFPTIYNDPARVDEHLIKAMALPDLTTTQREQLIELSASYRPEYERFTRSMVDQLGTTPLSVMGIDQAGFAEWQLHQQELSRIKYDRNELNARAITRLRSTLTPSQIEVIGGLPEPVGEEAFFLYR